MLTFPEMITQCTSHCLFLFLGKFRFYAVDCFKGSSRTLGVMSKSAFDGLFKISGQCILHQNGWTKDEFPSGSRISNLINRAAKVRGCSIDWQTSQWVSWKRDGMAVNMPCNLILSLTFFRGGLYLILCHVVFLHKGDIWQLTTQFFCMQGGYWRCKQKINYMYL